MSLLLKALEKSDQDKEGEVGAASGAAAAPSSGGMKLAGGGASRPSKLGSALSSKKSGDDEAQAGRVVAAYEQGDAPSFSDEAVVKAAAQARRRNIVMLGVVIVLAAGGYFAYQRFAPQFSSQEPVVAAEDATASASTDGGVAEAVTEVNLLPLSEPFYDIQESIILASAGLQGNTIVATGAGGEENLADSIAQLVTDILAAQVEVEGGVQVDVEQVSVLEEEVDPLAELLSSEFDLSTARKIDSSAAMLAKLEELENARFVAPDGKQFVKPSSVSIEEAINSNGTGSADSEQAPTVQENPQLIARQDNAFAQLMQQGIASYQAGNYNAAENAFRTIIGKEPRNSQALVGLAKVHQARGSIKLAVATLLKAAEYSPDNASVVGELIALQSASADTLLAESRIRSLISRTNNPITQSRLLFALGTLAAKQSRWIEAKAAFYQANTLDATNPDIAYNLAVVFDYFNEKDNAIDAYQHALNVAGNQPSSFDPNVVRNRISKLEAR